MCSKELLQSTEATTKKKKCTEGSQEHRGSFYSAIEELEQGVFPELAMAVHQHPLTEPERICKSDRISPNRLFVCEEKRGRELVHLHWPTFTNWEVEPPVFLCLHLIPPWHPKDPSVSMATLQCWVKKKRDFFICYLYFILPIFIFSSLCVCWGGSCVCVYTHACMRPSWHSVW